MALGLQKNKVLVQLPGMEEMYFPIDNVNNFHIVLFLN
jgi:hypothetical protein